MLLLDELLSHFRNLCMLTATNNDFSLIPAGSGTRNDLARQTKEFTLGEIMRCMDILQDCIARTPKTAKRKTVAEMCLIRLCTPRLDSDFSALSLRLEKLENRLDKLCDGEISIQPRSTVTTNEITRSAEPVRTVSNKPQDIIADTLNKIENKINTVSANPEDEKAPDAPMQQTEINQSVPDSKPDRLFDGTGGADDNTSALNEDAPPFDLDEPQASIAPAPQEQASKTGGNGDKPDWLFEGTGGTDDNASTGNDDVPPFDLDEPPINVAPAEPAQQAEQVQSGDIPPRTAYEQSTKMPKTQGTGNADPRIAEILDRLPVILQAILGQVQVTLGRDTVNISGYQKFQYDFLTTGDSKERLEKTAGEVLGRKVKMVFDGDDNADTQTAENDPISDFLTKAEKMGVKIKYKKSKN